MKSQNRKIACCFPGISLNFCEKLYFHAIFIVGSYDLFKYLCFYSGDMGSREWTSLYASSHIWKLSKDGIIQKKMKQESALSGFKNHPIVWNTCGSSTEKGWSFWAKNLDSKPTGKYPGIFLSDIHTTGRGSFRV